MNWYHGKTSWSLRKKKKSTYIQHHMLQPPQAPKALQAHICKQPLTYVYSVKKKLQMCCEKVNAY